MGPLGWVALAGVNALLASSKAAQAAKQRKMEADLRAAEIEAAPWTGKTPSTQISTTTPNIWGELAGAGVNTLSQAAALQQSGLLDSATPTPDMQPSMDMQPTGDMMPDYTAPEQTSTLMPPTEKEAFDVSQDASFLYPASSKRNLWATMYRK